MTVNWSNLWSGFIGALVGSGLVQAYLNHRFSQKLEQLKTTLSRELFEHQTKFAWFYTERAKTLVNLYSLLAAMHEAFVGLVRPMNDGSEELIKKTTAAALDAAVAFFGFWIKNLVFFDEDLIRKLEKLDDEYKKVWLLRKDAVSREAWLEACREGWKKLKKDLIPLLPEIQHKIKDMLGADK
jgi:hypothetical protein